MPDCVMIEMHPAYRKTRDDNKWQEAAETVAYEHFRKCTPEFVEYLTESLGDRIPFNSVAAMISAITREAHILQQAKGVADCVREDFVQFVANSTDYSSWALERQMYREVKRAAP
jgi:hypothetical protein